MAFVRKPIPSFEAPPRPPTPPPPPAVNRPIPRSETIPTANPLRSNPGAGSSSIISSRRDDYSELGWYEETPDEEPMAADRRVVREGWHNAAFDMPLDPRRHQDDSGFYDRRRPDEPHNDDRHYRDSQPQRYSTKERPQRHSVKRRESRKRKSGVGNPLICVSNAIVTSLEKMFYRLGYTVAKYPAVVIVMVLVVAGAASSGIYRLRQETEESNLWVPFDTEGKQAQHLSSEHFPSNNIRVNTFIVTPEAGASILTPKALSAMADLHTKVININSINKGTNLNFDALCVKLGSHCLVRSVLELWNYDVAQIKALNQGQILDKFKSLTDDTRSPRFHNKLNVSKYLADIELDGDGKIKRAGVAQMQYILNFSKMEEPLRDWEGHFLEIGEAGHSDLNMFRFAFRSLKDVSQGAVFGDLNYLMAGYVLVLIFVTVVLGRFDRIQHRLYVSLTGIFCIVMAMGMSLGLCSYADVAFTPLNNILPFLLLGLGVDDMFVVASSLDNLKKEDRWRPVPERMGLALKSGGVSILVTSLTDMIAFGVGISTAIPALRSFCIYCMMGILFTFIFQATFFVAWLAVDEYRADAHRDAFFFCVRLTRWSPSNCSKFLFMKHFFRSIWGGFITHIVVKVVVLLVSAGLLALGIYGTIHLDQTNDWTLFIPGDSYVSDYIGASKLYFPQNTKGITTAVYLIGTDIDYYANYTTLQKLHSDLEAEKYTEPGTVRSWWTEYRHWLNISTTSAVTDKLNADKYPKTEDDYYDLLVNDFLKSASGAVHKQDIMIILNKNRISASRNTLRQHMLTDVVEEIQAMENIRKVVKTTGFTREQAFAFSREYLVYEGSQAIRVELYRNLGLAFLCVAIITLVLIANIPVSFYIFLCVIMTLVDVGGTMYFIGLSIDTSASIILIMAMGLSIDFSAHLGLMFMTTIGSRNERVKRSLVLIGPAVFSGSFSTFLAFVLLIFSTSYVFKLFFKIFLAVILLGLFHGLVFLPVILSLIGPACYPSARNNVDADEDEDEGRAEWDDTKYDDYPNTRKWSDDQHRDSNRFGDLYRSRHERRDESKSKQHRNSSYMDRNLRQSAPFAVQNIYTLGRPQPYVKPTSYTKPSMYLKPTVLYSDDFSPTPHL